MEPNSKLLSRTSQVLIDGAIFLLAYFTAFLMRFEGIPDGIFIKQLTMLFPYILFARLLSFMIFSVYSIVWRYISIVDVISISKATLPLTILLLLGRLFLPDKLALLRLPISVITLEFLLVLFGALGARMTRRFAHELLERGKYENDTGHIKKKRTILIGAGDAGNIFVKELKQRKDLGIDVVGFIDDNPKKHHSMIQGVKVLGKTNQIPEIAKKFNIEEGIITIANASSKEIRRIVNLCKDTKIKVKVVPGLFEILDGKIKITKIREVNIDDLLGRRVVSFQNHIPKTINHYKNKKILVTGAGGSIGSELCRQIVSLKPKEIILLDKDEYSIYEIHQELTESLSSSDQIKISPIIADLRNIRRFQNIFETHHPEIIFHAAAHKHVPLMERNVSEAISNNILGTKYAAQYADRYGVDMFLYISSDKAVNPTSVMGASKKIGEIIIQEIASKSETKYSCVRFGNVLGSRGSIIPLLQKQISQGKPLTITDPKARRYFMSISEAVQLIIQAGTLGQQGEIFVLDMGEPINIQELAEDLIKLSGFTTEEIELKFIGLRPGEKLYEELLIDEEKSQVTKFDKIFIAPPIKVDADKFKERLETLLEAADNCNKQIIIEQLRGMEIGYNHQNNS